MNASLYRLIVRFPGFLTHETVRPSDRKSGQAMVEYAICAVIFTSMVAVLAIFLYTFREYGGRVLDLVASEYP